MTLQPTIEGSFNLRVGAGHLPWPNAMRFSREGAAARRGRPWATAPGAAPSSAANACYAAPQVDESASFGATYQARVLMPAKPTERAANASPNKTVDVLVGVAYFAENRDAVSEDGVLSLRDLVPDEFIL